MENLTEDQQRYVAAQAERTQLRDQAWNAHKGRPEHVERVYQRELENTERVFRLRTGTGEQAGSARSPVTLCQYCGRGITQDEPGYWAATTTKTYCPRSASGRHSPA